MTQTPTSGTRLFACLADDLADGESLTVEAESPIAVFRVGDEFFATSDTCSHEKWSLGEEGEMEGFEVTCTLHMARFDVRDGRALCFPAIEPLRSFGIERDGDSIYVVVPES